MTKRHRSTFRLPRRRRWNAADAGDVLAVAESSGKSLEEFALENDLKLQRLSVWRRRLQKESRSAPVFREIAPIPIQIPVGAARTPTMELTFPSGLVLRFDPASTIDQLRAVVRALEGI
jgi:transposase-like protein